MEQTRLFITMTNNELVDKFKFIGKKKQKQGRTTGDEKRVWIRGLVWNSEQWNNGRKDDRYVKPCLRKIPPPRAVHCTILVYCCPPSISIPTTNSPLPCSPLHLINQQCSDAMAAYPCPANIYPPLRVGLVFPHNANNRGWTTWHIFVIKLYRPVASMLYIIFTVMP